PRDLYFRADRDDPRRAPHRRLVFDAVAQLGLSRDDARRRCCLRRARRRHPVWYGDGEVVRRTRRAGVDRVSVTALAMGAGAGPVARAPPLAEPADLADSAGSADSLGPERETARAYQPVEFARAWGSTSPNARTLCSNPAPCPSRARDTSP